MFEAGIELKTKFGSDNVYDFSIGNPDLPPPPEFFKILKDLAGKEVDGAHGYMPNAGYTSVRDAVAVQASRELGVKLTGENIIMTCGAAGALNVIFKTILNPGDQVIVLKPYFVEYGFYIGNHSGEIVLVDTNSDFSINIDKIKSAISPRTKAVLINSPNNPTGRVYREQEIKSLAKLLEDRAKNGQHIYLISDEPYRKIVYDDIQVPSILKLYPNSIAATSYSKTLSIPGERIGYIAANPACNDYDMLIAGMIMSNRILGFVNAPALIQRIVAGLTEVSVDVAPYKRRRDLLMDGLGRAGYDYFTPEGAFYLFCKSPVADDAAFAKHLQKFNILVVPGIGFGAPGYFRISYTVPDRMIEKSLKGFADALKSI
jgi:aspartate aminotransferase